MNFSNTAYKNALWLLFLIMTKSTAIIFASIPHHQFYTMCVSEGDNAFNRGQFDIDGIIKDEGGILTLSKYEFVSAELSFTTEAEGSLPCYTQEGILKDANGNELLPGNFSIMRPLSAPNMSGIIRTNPNIVTIFWV
jgi:hypothetical protein